MPTPPSSRLCQNASGDQGFGGALFQGGYSGDTLSLGHTGKHSCNFQTQLHGVKSVKDFLLKGKQPGALLSYTHKPADLTVSGIAAEGAAWQENVVLEKTNKKALTIKTLSQFSATGHINFW